MTKNRAFPDFFLLYCTKTLVSYKSQITYGTSVLGTNKSGITSEYAPMSVGGACNLKHDTKNRRSHWFFFGTD